MHIAELSCAAVVPATIFWDLEAGVAAPSEKHLQTMRKVFELIARQRREAEALACVRQPVIHVFAGMSRGC